MNATTTYADHQQTQLHKAYASIQAVLMLDATEGFYGAAVVYAHTLLCLFVHTETLQVILELSM